MCVSYRSVLSPQQLIGRYPSPNEHIATLYENLECTASRQPDVTPGTLCPYFQARPENASLIAGALPGNEVSAAVWRARTL